jgi:hypothetical protein
MSNCRGANMIQEEKPKKSPSDPKESARERTLVMLDMTDEFLSREEEGKASNDLFLNTKHAWPRCSVEQDARQVQLKGNMSTPSIDNLSLQQWVVSRMSSRQAPQWGSAVGQLSLVIRAPAEKKGWLPQKSQKSLYAGIIKIGRRSASADI